MLTADAAEPVALAKHAVTAAAGVAKAVPPQMEMLALRYWQTAGVGAGAGAVVTGLGKEEEDGATAGAVGQLTDVG